MSYDTKKPRSKSRKRKHQNPLRTNTYRLRQAVRPSISEQFPDKPQGFTIDHYNPPFWVLRDEWFHIVGHDPKRVMPRPLFERLKRHWVGYHNSRCNRKNGGLVIASVEENLSRSNVMQAMIAEKKRGGV